MKGGVAGIHIHRKLLLHVTLVAPKSHST
jgi:hypothetical protein